MNIHQKKLSALGDRTLTLVGHKYASIIRDHLVAGDVKCFYDVGHGGQQIPYENPDSTFTFELCISVSLFAVDESFLVTVDDGDSFSGQPLGMRASYSFEGDWWKIKPLRDLVDEEFSRHAANLLLTEDRLVWEARCKIVEDRLLADQS